VRYAHEYGVQVLVTLNTLLHDDEYAQASALAHALYRIGVDALIIQDLHLLDYDLPPIRLHASTQCDNRTAEDVIRLQQLGFKRVVLARELGIQEIGDIHRAVVEYSNKNNVEPIELEAFIHGALCVSYSGKCFISEVLCGRSANRGACSQYCRMAYDLLDANMQEVIDDNGQPIHQRYLLSLQDMDRSAYLAEMIEVGVSTLKIEGRLKDADYVTNVTAYYRELLDRLIPREGHLYHRTFIPNPEKTFHRGGTDYFLHGRTPHMANWETPKSTGEYIGEVLTIHGNRIHIRLKEGIQLHNGDGLTMGSEGFNVNGVEGDIIVINKHLTHSHCHLPLYRNLDIDFTKSLHSERRIPVDIVFSETEDGFCIRIGEKEQTFIYPKELARNAEKALQTIETQLSKLGDSMYIAREVKIESKPYFIPISILNEWRRKVVKDL
jgi:putative protease